MSRSYTGSCPTSAASLQQTNDLSLEDALANFPSLLSPAIDPAGWSAANQAHTCAILHRALRGNSHGRFTEPHLVDDQTSSTPSIDSAVWLAAASTTPQHALSDNLLARPLAVYPVRFFFPQRESQA